MNHSVYVFGELGNGYTQYPDDYTKDFFKKLQKQNHAQTQLAIHRDGELMYYAYTRKLSESSSNNQYIGMCCVFNGVYTDKYKELFDVCEKAVTSLVVNGDLLEFTNSGEITSKIDKLYKAESHFKAFSEYLSLQIGVAFSAVQKLPPINYAISTEDVKRLKVDDSPSDISNAIRDYSTVIISKNDGYNSASLTSYAGKLKSLSVEISSLKSQVSSLHDTISKLEKEKKRTKLVAWLMTGLAVLAFIFFCVWTNMSDTINNQSNHIQTLVQANEDLENKNSTLATNLNNKTNECKRAELEISNLKQTLIIKSDSIESLLFSNNSLNSRITELNKQIAELNKRLSSNKDLASYRKDLAKMPFIITEVQVANTYEDGNTETNYGGYLLSKNTMYLTPKFKYVGAISGNKTIYVKFFSPYGMSTGSSSPSGYSYSYSMYVYMGKNEATISGWGSKNKGHWAAGEYRWEFYCDGVCVGTHSFTVH